MIKFDFVTKKEYENYKINYAWLKGNETVVIIKIGAGETYQGKDNLYLKLAFYIKEKYNYSVLICTTPIENDNNFANIINVIDEIGFDFKNLYFMGYSKGGSLALIDGYKYEKIKKILIINAPLMMNLHKILFGVEKYNGLSLAFVYGEFDPSYKFLDIFKLVENQKICFKTLENTGHNFDNQYEVFVDLLEEYLLKE